ncbi:MAG TPA: tetratricopeptide repeat protein [Armatimonadota bacterium]|jgi:tetratricopeptide (TPR) repeat protein
MKDEAETEEEDLTLRWTRRSTVILVVLLALAAGWWLWARYGDMPLPVRRALPPPAATAEAFKQQATDLVAAGKFLEIIDLATATLAAHPEMAAAYEARMEAESSLGRFTAARADLDRALALSPDNAFLFRLRAVLPRKSGASGAKQDLLRSQALYERDLRANPTDLKALLGSARVLDLLHQDAAALAAIDFAVDQHPDSAGALRTRALLHQHAKDYAPALADYERAIALEPRSVWGYLDRARCYHAIADYDATRADLDAALTINPDCLTVLNEYGWLLEASGHYSQALPYHNRVLRLDPTNRDALFHSAYCYYYMGQYRRCTKRAARYLERCGEDPAIYNLRGNARMKIRYYDLARADFQRAVALDPGGESGAAARDNLAGLDEWQQEWQKYLTRQSRIRMPAY